MKTEIKYLASVVVPTFNDSKRLLLLIKSLESQTCTDFEIIIVDDGSTDNTEEAIETLKIKSKIQINYFYLPNTKIFGAGIARNFGAKKAKSNILIFLDQDNVADKKLIENHINEQKKCDIVLGYCAGYGNKKRAYKFEGLKKYVEEKEQIKIIIPEFRDQIFNNPKKYLHESWKYFASGNFSIKKDLFIKFLFDEKIIKWGGTDIDLGYRLFKKDNFPIFSKKCLSYNSSDKPLLNYEKFLSSMNVLSYLFNKYKTEEMKNYCFERFYYTPFRIKRNSKLVYKNEKFIFIESTKVKMNMINLEK